MFAAVDLGSNSFRLHVGKHEGDAIRVIKSARDPIRLAAGLDKNGNLSEQAIATAVESLGRFRAILRDYHLDAVRVVANQYLARGQECPGFFAGSGARHRLSGGNHFR